jgi:micrococcal nuclease
MYDYRAVIVKWLDGDTLIAHLDQGFHDWKHDQRFRLVGIDAPDKQPWKGEAKAFAEAMWPPGSPIIIWSVRDKRGDEKNSFERWMADAYDPQGRNLPQTLVAAGMAVPWNGQGPHPTQPGATT